jgi:nicotinamidase-related amidase
MASKGTARWALLIVDFISRFDFDGAEKLAPRALAAAERTAALRKRAQRDGVPCIYANDNFGHWRSEFSRLVEECAAAPGVSGRIASLLRPGSEDYSILKPRHSAFYGTPLDFLLEELEVGCLALTGVAADNCIFATAQDAYVRKFRLWVPADCVAAQQAGHERESLGHMARTMKADVRPTAEVEGWPEADA